MKKKMRRRKFSKVLQCVKLEKNLIKQILINLFGLLENENIYIYNFFLGDFLIDGMKKKKMRKKKMLQSAVRLLPIFSMHWVTIQQFV